MSNELIKWKKRKADEKKLQELYEKSDKTLIIHYSCESFFNIKDGRTPRVTSIAIRNLESGQTESFSIHKVAEKKSTAHNEIENNYDELEKNMLEDFFKYLEVKRDYTFVHWNMRDINYGFPAIEHRFEVLGGKPYKISDDKKFDLANKLVSLYGKGYVGHGENGRFLNLLKVNRITDKGALTGAEEAQAFDDKEYIKLHQSTLRKADCMSNIFLRTIDGSLKSNSTWFDRNGVHPKIALELIQDHWMWSLITVLGGIGGLSWLLGSNS